MRLNANLPIAPRRLFPKARPWSSQTSDLVITSECRRCETFLRIESCALPSTGFIKPVGLEAHRAGCVLRCPSVGGGRQCPCAADESHWQRGGVARARASQQNSN